MPQRHFKVPLTKTCYNINVTNHSAVFHFRMSYRYTLETQYRSGHHACL